MYSENYLNVVVQHFNIWSGHILLASVLCCVHHGSIFLACLLFTYICRYKYRYMLYKYTFR